MLFGASPSPAPLAAQEIPLPEESPLPEEPARKKKKEKKDTHPMMHDGNEASSWSAHAMLVNVG